MRKKLVLVPTSLALALSAAIIVGVVLSRPKPHRVHLTWHAPTPVKNVTVVGYNVYRSTSKGGPYVRIADSLRDLSYTDPIINSGTTYHYVVTSVGQGGRESRFSLETTAVIP